jgi:molybdenum cofactor cytidylyltransferase
MISAVILAAGESRRMGQPKMLLPWGDVTVLEYVISVYMKAGLKDILVVTGGARKQVETLLEKFPVHVIYNEEYARGEMLSSLQCGIRALPRQARAMLIGLGDQPQVREISVRLVCDTFRETGSGIIVPSYQMKRGHPWLVARPLWKELMDLRAPQSPRDFLNHHAKSIHYLNVDDPGILADLDTPQDYQKWHPE